jgi:hypothetical protein
VGGLLPAIAYYVPIATADRKPWRKRRDRVTAAEWLVLAGVVPIAVAVVLDVGWHVSLHHHAHELAVLLVAFIGGGLAGIVDLPNDRLVRDPAPPRRNDRRATVPLKPRSTVEVRDDRLVPASRARRCRNDRVRLERSSYSRSTRSDMSTNSSSARSSPSWV